MSTHVSTSDLQNSREARCADFSQGTLVVTGDSSGCVSVYSRPSCSDQWTTACRLLAHDSPAIQVAVAPSCNTVASTDGFEIRIWRPSATDTGEPQWGQEACLTTKGGISLLRFTTNADSTLWLAAAAKDGTIRIYQPSLANSEYPWQLHSIVHSDWGSSQLDAARSPPSITIAWKPSLHSDGISAMLVAGRPSGGAVVWWHDSKHGRWRRGPNLKSATNYSSNVTAVAWAPPSGRPTHLVAIAHGRSISIWHLSGPADSLQVEEVAQLKAKGQVLQMEFNMMGSWLAASIQAGTVQLFRPLLDGSWHLLSEVCSEQISDQKEMEY